MSIEPCEAEAEAEGFADGYTVAYREALKKIIAFCEMRRRECLEVAKAEGIADLEIAMPYKANAFEEVAAAARALIRKNEG